MNKETKLDFNSFFKMWWFFFWRIPLQISVKTPHKTHDTHTHQSRWLSNKNQWIFCKKKPKKKIFRPSLYLHRLYWNVLMIMMSWWGDWMFFFRCSHFDWSICVLLEIKSVCVWLAFPFSISIIDICWFNDY